MATLAEFREAFPELSARPDDAVVRALQVAQAIHCLRHIATLYCAAHLLVVADDIIQPDGGQAEATERGMGQLTTKYQAQAERGRESFFTTSSYGRQFLTLERRSSYAMSVRVY